MERRFGVTMRWARLLLVAPLLAATLAIGMAAPAGAAYLCAFEDITGETIRQSVVVPAGTTCGLNDVVVRGGVTVEPGGLLTVNNSEIRGSIVANEHLILLVLRTEVRGSISATGSTNLDSFGVVQVRGDLTISGSGGDRVDLTNSTIRGSVIVTDNNVVNYILVSGNAIGADLVCTGNNPPPTTVHPEAGELGPNTVAGVKSGQCAGL